MIELQEPLQFRNTFSAFSAYNPFDPFDSFIPVNVHVPNAPVFRNVVLEPPRPEERAEINQRESIVDHSNLIGVRGVTTTHLRPAGKAEIARELIDVIAEGEPLDRGTPVIVVDAHANRVVVRAVGPT